MGLAEKRMPRPQPQAVRPPRRRLGPPLVMRRAFKRWLLHKRACRISYAALYASDNNLPHQVCVLAGEVRD